jgi:two-component SAPR family response regulator
MIDSKKGLIILIDDDTDDLELSVSIIKKLSIQNKILPFDNCDDVFDYLLDPQYETPFMIISDINLPKVNGIELKKKIDEHPVLKAKSIPFIYYSTSGQKRTIDTAFQHHVQGYFVKGTSEEEITSSFKLILDYWNRSKHP